MKKEIKTGYKYPERKFQRELKKIIDDFDNFNTISVVCIGSDKATGDCLGPLVGTFLEKEISSEYIKIYGTLDSPVHAKNLSDIVKEIEKDSLVIAVDASLGAKEDIGKIFIRNGPLIPGASLNKNLEKIGDISITGIVNTPGKLNFFSIITTRLSIVYDLSKVIAKGLKSTLNKQAKELLIKEEISLVAATKQ